MFTLPPAIVEAVQHIDVNTIVSAVNEYGPVFDRLNQIWTKDTFRELLDGNLAVPDDMINEALAKRIEDDPDVKALTVTSRADGQLEILADLKSSGRVKLTGTVDEFVFNQDEATMMYTIKKKSLLDHKFIGWFFSRMSLSMTEKIFGKVSLADDLPTTIKHNTVIIDFRSVAENSELADLYVRDTRVLDMIEIEQAVPKDGYIAFKVKFNIPDSVKDMLKSMLKGE